jgi:hypothetical protein
LVQYGLAFGITGEAADTNAMAIAAGDVTLNLLFD